MKHLSTAMTIGFFSILLACAGAAKRSAEPTSPDSAYGPAAESVDADSDGADSHAEDDSFDGESMAEPAPAVSGESADAPRRAESRAIARPGRRPAVVARAGVKAGEWDDNANYREFQRYLASQAGLRFSRADVDERQFLVVRDAQGKAVPGCPITIHDELGNRTELVTTSSGRAILFPRVVGLTGSELSMNARCLGAARARAVSLAQSPGVVTFDMPRSRARGQRTIDVAFILDTTGSMSEEIAAVKGTIESVANLLGEFGVSVRIGLVEYKDRGDAFVTRVHPMTANISGFARRVSSIEASGGGDTPESANEGLHVAITRLQWNPQAVARLAFLIGDAPPHLDYAQDVDYVASMRNAAGKGVQIFTIAASGMDGLGQVIWRQIAQYTGGTHMFVLRGGAGPQSTGGGDPKASCGGTQSNFASGNLDALIGQKIRHALALVDADPMLIPGLDRDENAKPCDQRISIAY